MDATEVTGPAADRAPRLPRLPRWLGTPRARYLPLGDWNPVVRDPIDVLHAALLVGSVVLIVLDKNVEAAPLVTVLIALCYASLYEIYEFFAGAVLGTTLQKSLGDTNGDLLAGAIGAACGGGLMLLWTHRGWRVTRRVPAEVINRIWPVEAP